MHFHFCSSNHDLTGKGTLYDMFCWFRAGLLELGHKVTISQNAVDPSAINIFWENFYPDMGKIIQRTKITYGIIATELPDDQGFNWRRERTWIYRWQGFPEVAKNASFIWTMIEQTIPFYSQFCPTAFVELGFSKLLIPKISHVKPDIDFSFFGLRTPYRIEITEQLKKYAKVVWPEHFLSHVEVAQLISRTKIGLSFKQSPEWPIPSPTRLGRFLMAKRGIVLEETPIMTKQSQLVPKIPANSSFIDFALSRLNNDWKQDAEHAFNAYQSTLPMKNIMEEVIEKTISHINTNSVNQNKPRRIKLSLALPKVIDTISLSKRKQYNIIYYNEKYYAVNQSLGEINFLAGDDALKEKYADRVLIRSSLKTLYSDLNPLPTEYKATSSNP